MPYEHPLVFGGGEYFWDDATFHDDCIGIHIDETDCDEIEESEHSIPPQKKVRTCSTQTESPGRRQRPRRKSGMSVLRS